MSDDAAADAATQKLVAEVGAESDADVLVYSGPMSDHGFLHVGDACRARRVKQGRVLLYLTTFGGSANAAYRIARRLQRDYKTVAVIVNSFCKSAGTLLCLGAHELILSVDGELGPLDVQMLKPGEILHFDPDSIRCRASNIWNPAPSKCFATTFSRCISEDA